MATSKDDLPIAQVNMLLTDPRTFDPRAISEPFTQYVRHYIYMVKRSDRMPQESNSDSNQGSPAHSSGNTAESSSKLKSASKKSPTPKKRPSAKKSSK